MNIYISMAILYLLLINTFENAYLFSICFLITMLLSDIIITAIKRFVYPNIRIPVSLMITGTIITIIELIIKKYIPGFYNDIGLYLPLMMLIIYNYDSNDSLKKSLINTFKKAMQYVLVLLGLILVKEILGTNTVTLMDNISNITGYRAIYRILPDNNLIPMPLLVSSGGSFILVGLALGVMNKIKGGNND
ncbi:MAG: hypothetical protein IJ565_03055 [Bacilli bacterium]|nr:hypothetical protein [Bacilli bacterium]